MKPSIRTSNRAKSLRSHIVIPDTQCKPGVKLDHLSWVGQYIAHRKPDVVVVMGDWWDMPSLSSYDSGKKSFEGRRYKADIEAGLAGMRLFTDPINRMGKERPRMVFLMGNHEERILRAVESDAKLDGTIGYQDLKLDSFGFEVYDFLKVVEIDSIRYSHFFPRSASGAVVQAKRGAPSARAQLQREGKSCTAGHQQGLDVSCLPLGGKLQWGIIAGSCLAPDHRVLTADLRYVLLGDLKPGDKLVSFDEHPGAEGKRSRRFVTGTVIAARTVLRDDRFKVVLESGKWFVVTSDHLWYRRAGVGYDWIQTRDLKVKDRWGATHIPKLIGEWDTSTTYEAGWLSGLYDGEGHLYRRRTTAGWCMQLGLSQKKGPVLDRARTAIAEVLGFRTTADAVHNDVMSMRIVGGSTKIAEVLGKLRPTRLLPKFEPEMLGRIHITGTNDAVVAIEPAGRGSVVEVDVDAKTMIVEGYGHHNCYQHDEQYLSPQGNDHWRGLIVKHEVDGRGGFNPMFVSLDYLKRRYGRAKS